VPQGEYTAADLNVLTFDESVRRRPGMYFGAALDDPRLPTTVLHHVVDHAIHPAPHLAEPHRPMVTVEILGDLAFSITDDQLCRAERCRVPECGDRDSLLGPDRWPLAAAAAVSRRTVVEVRSDGHGLRQELVGLHPVGPPEPVTASYARGTTVMVELDPALLGPAAAITTDIEAIGRCQGDHCYADVPTRVTVQDRRAGR